MPLNRDLIDAARNLPQEPETPAVGDTDLVHTGGCFHRIYGRLAEGRAAYLEAEARFRAVLTPAQEDLFMELDAAQNAAESDEHVAFVEELARHLPGLAPAIRAVAYEHIFDQRPAARGLCCRRPPWEDRNPTPAA